MPRRYDWPKIRNEYVTGSDTLTLESLAKKYGPVIGSVRRRSSQEQWAEERAEYREAVARKTRQQITAREVSVRVRHQQIARALQEKAVRRLKQLDPECLTASEVRQFLKDAIAIERDAMELPSLVRVEVDSELDRMFDMLERELPAETYDRILDIIARARRQSSEGVKDGGVDS